MPHRILGSEFNESAIDLSPDGRWLAYQSDETGEFEVYVRPFPDVTAGKWHVSVGGGTSPLRAHNGRELFYVDGDRRMIAAQIQASDVVSVTERRPLFDATQFFIGNNHTNFDISPDDQRFVMQRVVGSDAGGVGALILVENWFEEVKERIKR